MNTEFLKESEEYLNKIVFPMGVAALLSLGLLSQLSLQDTLQWETLHSFIYSLPEFSSLG